MSLTLLPWKGKRRKTIRAKREGEYEGLFLYTSVLISFLTIVASLNTGKGDTIVGKGRKSCVVTLVERSSKHIVTLPTQGRTATDIEQSLHEWLTRQVTGAVKSITFDRGLEFARWQQAIRDTSTSVFFADPGSPGQRGLNENSNGLLRRSGLPKSLDFNTVTLQYYTLC
ncbi:IS30 family transposase, partial [Alloscardovia venturai]